MSSVDEIYYEDVKRRLRIGFSIEEILGMYLSEMSQEEKEKTAEAIKKGLIDGKTQRKQFENAKLQEECLENDLLREFMQEKGRQIAYDTTTCIVERVGEEFIGVTLDWEEQEEIALAIYLYIEAIKKGNQLGELLPQIMGYCVGVQLEACSIAKENLKSDESSKIIARVMAVAVFLIAEAILLGIGAGGFMLIEKLETFEFLANILVLILGIILVGIGIIGAGEVEDVWDNGGRRRTETKLQKESVANSKCLLNEILDAESRKLTENESETEESYEWEEEEKIWI